MAQAGIVQFEENDHHKDEARGEATASVADGAKPPTTKEDGAGNNPVRNFNHSDAGDPSYPRVDFGVVLRLYQLRTIRTE